MDMECGDSLNTPTIEKFVTPIQACYVSPENAFQLDVERQQHHHQLQHQQTLFPTNLPSTSDIDIEIGEFLDTPTVENFAASNLVSCAFREDAFQMDVEREQQHQQREHLFFAELPSTSDAILNAKLAEIVEASADQPSGESAVLLGDLGTLEHLLEREKDYVPSEEYWEFQKATLKPRMRKILLEWLNDVTTAEKLNAANLYSASNYLDRILSVVRVGTGDLQALGSACLWVSSKLLDTRHISGNQLVFYTDNTVTLEKLCHWENVVINKLNWDLCTPSTWSYVDYFTWHCPSLKGISLKKQYKHMVQISSDLLVVADPRSVTKRPSLIACASACYTYCYLYHRESLSCQTTMLKVCSTLAAEVGTLICERLKMGGEEVDVWISSLKDSIVTLRSLWIDQQPLGGDAEMREGEEGDNPKGVNSSQPTTPSSTLDVVYEVLDQPSIV